MFTIKVNFFKHGIDFIFPKILMKGQIKAYSQIPPADGLLYLPLPRKLHKLFYVFVLYVNTFSI